MSARRLLAPSAAQLVEVLVSSAEDAAPLSSRLRQLLIARLTDTSARAGGPRRRLDAFSVERDDAGFTTPFAWGTRAARRAIGTAAARGVAQGRHADALRAASEEVERLCDRAERGLSRPGSLGAWLRGEPAPVRSLCALEAATWAGGLLALVTPATQGALGVGVADAWFEVPGTKLTLHGRRDAIAAAGERRSILRLRDGLPGDASLAGLAVEGLVESLAAPTRALPARVVGAWPDAGVCLVMDFDEDVARTAARGLVSAAVRRCVVPEDDRLVVAA